MTYPSRIFLTPEDAGLFANKYGHPKIGFGPCVGEPCVEYIRSDLVPQWQPIETAPKDGSWFWGKVDGDAISMRWHDEFGAFVSGWREMTFAASYGGGTRLHSPDVETPSDWMRRVY